jgi:hypothetical protein
VAVMIVDHTEAVVGLTHAEAPELIAKAFGYDNWNILSAKIEAAEPAASDERELSVVASRAPAPPPKTLYCSFCGKSQHEVRKLIEGPASLFSATSALSCASTLSSQTMTWNSSG